MNIEPGSTPLRLDDFPTEDDIVNRVEALERLSLRVVYLDASVQSLSRVKATLLALRASDISAILLLHKTPSLPAETVLEIFAFLRDWDQLLLHNVVALCGDWIPPEFQTDVQTEVKIELKWFKEWHVASHDARIAGLPWRSYIRKIVQENYAFSETFVRFAAPESEERSAISVDTCLRAFLKARKKAICLFPKKWGKNQ